MKRIANRMRVAVGLLASASIALISGCGAKKRDDARQDLKTGELTSAQVAAGRQAGLLPALSPGYAALELFDDPSAPATDAENCTSGGAINNSGVVVGWDCLPSSASYGALGDLPIYGGPSGGTTLSTSSLNFRSTTSLALPSGATSLWPRAVNDNGDILGAGHTSSTGRYLPAVLWQGTTHTLRVLQGLTGDTTVAGMTNDANPIVFGDTDIGGGNYGWFKYDTAGTSPTLLTMPSYAVTSGVYGMNKRRDVVGMTMHAPWSPTTPWYALAYKDATAEWVDLTTAMPSTSPFDRLEIARAINANRQAVGGGLLKPDGTGNWVRHAFKADLETGKTIDLGTIPGYEDTGNEYVANAINAKGHVVGAIYSGGTSTRYTDYYPYRAFVWTQEWGMRDLNSFIDPALGVTLQVAFGINDNDEVIGWMKRPGYGYRLYRIKIDVGGPEFFEPTDGMDCTVPSGINVSGQVAGYSDACDGPPWFWLQTMRPWVSEQGAPRALPMPSGVSSMGAWAVSDGGYVVGNTPSPFNNIYPVALYRPQALDQPEVLALGTQGASGMAIAHVAGASLPLMAVTATTGSGANLWQWGSYQVMAPGQSGQLTTIPQPPSGFTGEGGPTAMNRNGDLVGWYTLTGGTRNAMVWTAAEGLRDLNQVIGSQASEWFLRSGFGINDGRIIVGFGTHNSSHRAFRLDLATHEIVDLGTLESPYQALSYNANAINVQGHIVGTAGNDWDSAGYHLLGQRAFIYTAASGMTDLNDLVQMPPGWVLQSAEAINDNDEVTGTAYSSSQALRRAYKFKVPNLPPPTGTACTSGAQCITGFCVDGVCCDTACNGQCAACNLPGSVGTCTREANGTACSDGNRCSDGDSCQAGTCLPGPVNACTAPGDAKYVSVIDLGSTVGRSNANFINNNGVVVGSDTPPAAGVFQHGYPGSRGFRWSESEGMVYLPWDGAQNYADAINDAGVITMSAGVAPWALSPCRYDPAVDSGPVCQSSPGFSTGINAAGTATGWISQSGGLRMFRLDAGSIEIVPQAPGGGDGYGVWIDEDGTVVGMQNGTAVRNMAGRGTEILANILPAGSNWYPVNPAFIRSGQIVGWGYHGGYARAFRIKTTPNGDVTAIDTLPMPSTFQPDAANLMAADGMNGAGEIVGTIWDPGVTMPQAAYVYTDTVHAVDLNTLVDPESGWTLRAAWSINDTHQVVGFGTHDGVDRAFKLTLPDLSPCPPPGICQLAGTRDVVTGVCSYPNRPDGATCSDGAVCTQGETCQAGVCQPPANPYPVVLNLPVDDLGSLGIGTNATDINASGTVVGYSLDNNVAKHAWRWVAPGPIEDLETQLGLSPPSAAQAINDSGAIVGFQTQSDGAHAFRYGPSGVEDFGNIGDGTGAWSWSEFLRGTYATSVNNHGDVAGNYVVSGTVHGFRVIDGQSIEPLPTLVPGGTTLLYGIGETGTVVGSSWAQAGVATSDRAVLYDNAAGGLVDLNGLVVNPVAGFTLTAATSISGDYIAGWGVQDGNYRAFRLKRSTGHLDAITSGWVSSWVWDVNASGDVVGAGGATAEEYAASIGRAFAFTDQLGFKKLDDLVAQDSGWNLRGAYAINAGGEITGWGTHAGFGGSRPFHVRLPSGHTATCASRSMCGGDDGDGICLYTDGVVETSPGHFVAVFGYDNPAANSVHPGVNVVRLDGNVVAPVPAPPADLQPGTHTASYLPVFDAGHTISWTVGGETVTASASSRHLQPVVIGTNGVGVVIDGQTIVIKPDAGAACANAADGTPCDDGNACTRTDVCQAGACVGADPVVCLASDNCHTASCSPTTGLCSTTTNAGTCSLGAFDYDKAGRLIRDRGAELHYDAYDQLREVVPTASPPAFTNLTVDDLKTPGEGETQALAGHSNSKGHVPVAVSLVGGGYRTLLFEGNGTPLDLTAAAGMGTSVFGNSINDADAVAGTWSPGGMNHAFRYDHDGFHDLPNAGDMTIAYDINNQNQITGYFSVNGNAHGYRHSDSTGFQEIGTLGGAQSWGWRVDDLGIVSASAQTPDSPSTGIARFGHAALYQDIVGLQDLNTLVDPPLSGTTLAIANEKQGDWVVGIATQGTQSRAYRLKLSTGAFEDIGWAGSSFAYSVNSAGDAVGWGYTDAGETIQAGWILSERTGFAKLNDLIDPASGWDLRTAGSIDDFGDVVGWGYHNGRVSAYRLRIPAHSSGTGGPMVAEVHTYGYDGLRTSTTTAPGTANANTQVWFTQDYSEHDGNREHYVRIGNRIVAKVTLRPPPGGAAGGGMAALIDPRHPPVSLEDLVAKIFLAFLLAAGLAATGAGLIGKRRRPAWVAVTAGPVMLFFLASCDELNTKRQSAATVWERIETTYFHHGIAAGPVLTTNSDGTLREERRYEPFGQPINANVGGALGPVDFRREQQNSLGKLTNPNTGWSYHGERWMQPQTARWISPDAVKKAPDLDEIFEFARSSPYQFARNNPTVFWDPDGREEIPHAAPPRDLGVGLRPNFDLSTVREWHYSGSRMFVTLPEGMSQAQALSLVRKDFSDFATVNFRGNNVATSEVLPTGIARFHLKTISGLLSPVMFDPTFMVQLFKTQDPKRGPVQNAFTVAEHPLQGMRRWYATPSDNGKGITITTEAYEVGNHFYGRAGAWVDRYFLGTQAAMWETYLRNIDAKYFGAKGTLTSVSADSVEMANPLADPLKVPATADSQNKTPDQ
jgi:RHS repeat-associated protein